MSRYTSYIGSASEVCFKIKEFEEAGYGLFNIVYCGNYVDGTPKFCAFFEAVEEQRDYDDDVEYIITTHVGGPVLKKITGFQEALAFINESETKLIMVAVGDNPIKKDKD